MIRTDGPDGLDARLAASTPQTMAGDAALDDAIGAVVREARGVAGRQRGPRWLTRGVAITAGAALLVGAGTAGAVYLTSDAWLNVSPAFVSRSSTIDWLVTLPSGRTCVYRVWATDLTDEQLEATRELMRNPQALIDSDDGAVRERFKGELAIDGLDMDAVLDLAYAAVAAMDVDAGRGDIDEAQLGSVPKTLEDEVFSHSHMSIVLEAIGKPFDTPEREGMFFFTPDSACLVTP